MNPRPYQSAAIEAIEAGWSEARKQLAVLPTGSGKTIIFSWLAHRAGPQRTLILAHRDELIDQAIDKLHAATGIIAGREKAESSARLDDPVVVASVQSMQRRLDRWPRDHFGLVVADEAHHAISDQWQSVLRHFDSHARVLGVTATGERLGKRQLGSYFERVAIEVSLTELIQQGYLSRIVIQSIPVRIDMAGVRSTAGDYNEADLGRVLDPHLDAIATVLADKAVFRRTLVFVPLRITSRKLVGSLLRLGISAAHIDGESANRREILREFAAGRHDVLVNSALLLEGFDDPGIDCICMLRPTRSRSLYCQAIGRGTRIAPGKSELLVLDPLYLHQRHELIKPVHLVAETEEQAAAMAEKVDGKSMDLLEVQAAVNLEREESLRRELEEAARRSQVEKRVEGSPRAKGPPINAVSWSLAVGGISLADYEPSMAWEFRPVSDGQLRFLERNGFDPASVKNRGHASRIIDTLVGRMKLKLATPRQVRYLTKLHVTGAAQVRFDEANQLITERTARRSLSFKTAT